MRHRSRDSGILEAHDVRRVDAVVIAGLLEECGHKATVMGRSVAQETEFFMAAGAAGLIAAEIGGD